MSVANERVGIINALVWKNKHTNKQTKRQEQKQEQKTLNFGITVSFSFC